MSHKAPPPPFHVQSTIDNSKTFPHHSSLSALWNTKWRGPCSASVYPFTDGKLEDFEPIFDKLKSVSNDDTAILYQPDEYAKPFMPVGKRLATAAAEAESAGDTNKAMELYLRAAAVYRIARFPINRSPISQEAWELGKAAYIKGGKYLHPPNFEVAIPFTHADTSAGDKAEHIAACLRVPEGDPPAGGWPVVLFICGLDAYRTDHTNRTDMHTSAGFAILSVEIPGTGDCPAAPNDPESPDRLWSSVLDWISSVGVQKYGMNAEKIIARGVSTGGYYGFRIAHTHADRLLASVGQGGWSHDALSPDWVRAMNHMEYPFDLAGAIAHKLGYNSYEGLIKDDPKSRFSLKDSGILEMPSCRLFVVNGMEDSIFPIEDSILVATKGRVKDVRFMEGKFHMGNPGAEQIIIDWINEVVAGNETAAKPKTWPA